MNSQGLWMSAKTSVSPNDHKFPEALGKVLLYLDWVPKPITGARRARTMEPTRWSTQRHVTRFFLPTAWLGKYGTLLGGRKKEEKKKECMWGDHHVSCIFPGRPHQLVLLKECHLKEFLKRQRFPALQCISTSLEASKRPIGLR